MVWSGSISADEMALFPLISEMGYNGVELPIFDPAALDTTAVRQACVNSGLACTTSTAMPPGLSLIDDERQAQGVAFLQNVVRPRQPWARISCADRWPCLSGNCGDGVLPIRNLIPVSDLYRRSALLPPLKA